MSSKRRNIIACILILAAAFCGAFGLELIVLQSAVTAETWPASTGTGPEQTATTLIPTEGGENVAEPSTVTTTSPVSASEHSKEQQWSATEPGYENGGGTLSRGTRFLGFALCALAASAAAISVFVLRQREPLLGPDVLLILVGLLRTGASGVWNFTFAPGTSAFLHILLILASVREFCGWLRSRFSVSWCAMSRLPGKLGLPQLSLLFPALGILASVRSAQSLRYPVGVLSIPFVCVLLVCGLCFGILWNYGRDLRHFEKQLQSFRLGKAVTVGKGMFAADEQLLENIRAEHQEAVRTAVTSERFKVELISNVSHDLRTPLTSILGYGELLEKETLSENGKNQLARLNQKAGYMRDLVESLFELTKVSSGVLESKREQIDLIRLLEQTIGLFDDQLTASGLKVCRRYEMESAPVCTDGARMHQVFANLFSNAIKYALAGTRLHLEVREEELQYFVRLVNTASYEMDFDPEQILQRFARGDKARGGQGSGLGLAIAQTYTESVGGSFRVVVDGDQFSAIVCLPKTERDL